MSESASNDNYHSSSSDESLSSYESEVSDSVDGDSSSSDDSSGSSSVGSSYDNSFSDNDSRSSSHESEHSNSRSIHGNNNLNGSNIHRDDPQSLRSSNMSANHTAATYRGGQYNDLPNSKLTQRRNGKSLPQCRPEDEYEEPSRSKYRRRDKSSRYRGDKRGSDSSTLIIKYICCQTTKRSTQILIFAFVLWIVAQGYYFFNVNTNTNYRRQGRNGQQVRNTMERMIHHRHADEHVMEQLRKQRMIEAQIALGSAAGDAEIDTETGYRRSRDRGGKPIKTRTNGGRDRRSMGYNNNSRNHSNKSRDPEGNTRTERLRDGCSKLDWHDYHYPNCNEIHEIDMRRVIEYGKFGGRHKKKKNMDSSDDDEDSEDESSTDRSQTTQRKYPWGFVGNGLWRDVFTCDPREESLTTPVAPAVLKMMKSEHKYDARNFNRHRRDALVMERLSSSHHLVPIYGYCSQTVLTQAISHTLDDVIYAREHESVKKWSPNGGYKTKPPLESWMGTDEDGELLATRETEVGRIKLALGVFRGLVDLHEGDSTTNSSNWLPVVHADLQSKQYLIDAHTGQIYLNDFNRCRFMTKKDRPNDETYNATSTTSDGPTLKSCPLYIGSAPGSSRSPEEYSMEALSEKLDIYSAGNVLYGIITGNRPWNNERGKHIKSDIQKGRRPHVDDTIRNAMGTVDAELTRLLDRAYEHDPTKRASAREIVDNLEKLLDRELKKKE